MIKGEGRKKQDAIDKVLYALTGFILGILIAVIPLIQILNKL